MCFFPFLDSPARYLAAFTSCMNIASFRLYPIHSLISTFVCFVFAFFLQKTLLLLLLSSTIILANTNKCKKKTITITFSTLIDSSSSNFHPFLRIRAAFLLHNFHTHNTQTYKKTDYSHEQKRMKNKRSESQWMNVHMNEWHQIHELNKNDC